MDGFIQETKIHLKLYRTIEFYDCTAEELLSKVFPFLIGTTNDVN